MTHITIEVKIDPGCLITAAFEETLALANRLGVVISFEFNSVTCMAIPGGSAEAGMENYHEVIGRQYAFATTHKKVTP